VETSQPGEKAEAKRTEKLKEGWREVEAIESEQGARGRR